jgi:AraC-like DNA-binding protein
MLLDIKSTGNRKIIDFRKIGLNDLLVLGKYNYSKTEDKLNEHSHESMIEICYYDKGSQYLEVNGRQYHVQGGDVFIHFPGELHGTGVHPESKGVLYWMIINLDVNGITHITRLCSILIEDGKRHFKGNNQLRKWLDAIFSVYETNETNWLKTIRLYNHAESFLLSIVDCLHSQRHDLEDQPRLDKIVNFIHQNLKSNITISALAKEVNLSESRFKNLFKELTGFTPNDYIQREKVNLALKALSEDPDRSLTDLAYELNFSSPQYFSTVIKKYTGKSPGQLR